VEAADRTRCYKYRTSSKEKKTRTSAPKATEQASKKE
jgi:hypothetical protein